MATAERLPFAPGLFDLVMAITILCFVEDAAPVFQEIARVSRPRTSPRHRRTWQMELMGGKASHSRLARL
jgi:ubiquinone/menaquinone biosynthesis C-methylase UbiE